MKLFTSVFTLGCAFAFSYPAAAQTTETKYIEVTVTDSVIVLPDVIDYTITLQSEYNVNSMEMPVYDDNTDNTAYLNELKRIEEEAKMKMEVMEKKMKEYCTKSKVSWKENSSSSYSATEYSYGGSTGKSYLITFTSPNDLKLFLDKFPEDIKYHGELTAMRCSSTAKYEDKLLEKIIARANAQARKIASLSSVKLGGMIQYSDNVNEIAKGIEESIRALMRESKRRYDNYSFESLVLSKTVRIRFALE